MNITKVTIDNRQSTIDNGQLKTLSLPELSQEFEAIFLKSLFQEMEKTVPKSDLLSSNWVNGYYQEMLFQNLSEQLAKSGGIGIGQMLSKSLKLKGETANKIS